jgi:hypothetical protein
MRCRLHSARAVLRGTNRFLLIVAIVVGTQAAAQTQTEVTSPLPRDFKNSPGPSTSGI